MKYKIYIDETVKFNHELEIEIDEKEISKDKLQNILDRAEAESQSMGWEHIRNSLVRNNIRIVDISEDTYGDLCEIEITDCFED